MMLRKLTPAVVTAFKLRAYRYNTDAIFSGMVVFPASALRSISAAVAAFAARNSDPKMAMHVFTVNDALGFEGTEKQPKIGVIPYDAHGEAHARSSAGFKWLLDIPGVAAQTGVMTLRQVHDLVQGAGDIHGKGTCFLSGPLISDLDEELLVRAWKWHEDTVKADPALAEGTLVLLEFMQEVSRVENYEAYRLYRARR